MVDGSELKGTINPDEGPMVITPGLDVVSVVAWDSTTIDMTPEQARVVANRLIALTATNDEWNAFVDYLPGYLK